MYLIQQLTSILERFWQFSVGISLIVDIVTQCIFVGTVWKAFTWKKYLIRKVRDKGSWARISSRFSDACRHLSSELCCSRENVVEPMGTTSLVLDMVDVQEHDSG